MALNIFDPKLQFRKISSISIPAFRRHSAIGLPSSHLFPDTEYEDEYVEMEATSQMRYTFVEK